MKFAQSFLVAIAIGSVASACNIPVFRYALERWRPDPCEVIVFHDRDLTTEQAGLIAAAIGRRAGSADSSANASVVQADLSRLSARDREIWASIDRSPKLDLPYVVVRMQVGGGRYRRCCEGSLDAVMDANLFDSPARRELSRRLLSGHSIVWLMIGSDDPTRNQEARQMLSSRFAALEKNVQLPEGIGLPGSELHSEVPLVLKFSLLEVDRTDPKEQFLVRLLSGRQTAEFQQGEPLLVPVFGRGRAFEIIPANVLDQRLIEDLTAFLSGACSCQVKEQNPGFDLLLCVDWDTELFGVNVTPPSSQLPGANAEPVLLGIPPGR